MRTPLDVFSTGSEAVLVLKRYLTRGKLDGDILEGVQTLQPAPHNSLEEGGQKKESAGLHAHHRAP
eukprot:6594584-Pyramimonas_sp.AAC.1